MYEIEEGGSDKFSETTGTKIQCHNYYWNIQL